jgi:hypothetical protein
MVRAETVPARSRIARATRIVRTPARPVDPVEPNPVTSIRGGELFLTLMVVGLVALVMMALPVFRHHGHGPTAHAGHAALGRGGGTPRLAGGQASGGRAAIVAGTTGAGHEIIPADATLAGFLRFVPSPRAIGSVLALYGAFGNALVHAGRLPFATAALVAALPALLVEYFAVRPLWNLLFRFQGQPSSPLDALLLSEAHAVVPFRNGRGIVSVVRDGRLVQLAATLREDHAALPVKVGDRLRIEDVDARRERVTVSIVTYSRES